MANDEQYTPEHIVDLVTEVLGCITLDPASTALANKTVKADRFYTKEDNGLALMWFCNVFCNPPYSRGMMIQFVEKAIHEIEENNILRLCLLSNAMTSADWFQKAIEMADRVCYLKKRISFIDPLTGKPKMVLDKKTGKMKKGSNDRDQVMFYVGPEPERFERVFGPYGKVMRKA